MGIGLGQSFGRLGRLGGISLKGGMALLKGEAQGLGIDFTDLSGLGSVAVKDTGTPANNLSNAPVDSFLTQSGTSPKLVLWSDGLYRWTNHNLFVNSTSSPATQNVTLITGATYTYGVTGSGSLAGTVGASGTASAGSPVTFVATGVSGTFTITGSLTTMQINRGSALTTPYHATGAAAWYAVPIEWDGTSKFYGLVEPAATNLVLQSSDLTNASWVKANLTTALTATAPDGVADSATTITATADNATAYQAITSASSARVTSIFVKRRAGSGGVFMSQGVATGAELAINGDFTSSTGWTLTGATISGGLLHLSAVAGGSGVAYRTAAVTAGKTYKLTFTISNYSAGNIRWYVGGTNAILVSANGTYTQYVTLPSASDTFLQLDVTLGPATLDIDNVSLIECDETALSPTASWSRVAAVAGTATDPRIALRMATSGDAVDVAWFDHEVGTIATSPIPTFAATVTRGKDILSVATSAFPYNSAAGAHTEIMQASLSPFTSAVGGTMVDLGNSENGRLFAYITNSGELNFASKDNTGSLLSSFIVTGHAAATFYKWGWVNALNDFRIYRNGSSAAAAGTSGAATTAATTLRLGGDYTSSVLQVQKWKSFVYLPRALSNGELATRTAP